MGVFYFSSVVGEIQLIPKDTALQTGGNIAWQYEWWHLTGRTRWRSP